MEISYKEYEDGDIESVTIDGEEFEAEGISVTIPASVLTNFPTALLREEIFVQVCERIEENIICYDNTPFSIKKESELWLKVSFEDMQRRKFWNESIGLKFYMDRKREIILEREREIGDVSYLDLDDDGDYMTLTFEFRLECETLGNAILMAQQLLLEIEGAVELSIGKPFKSIEQVNSEADFTLSVVIPILRKLGFTDVRYNHGKREFGRDVIFSRKTEFEGYEYWGAQVKWGDISGGANSLIDVIIAQAEDSFRMPFFDIYTRDKRRISKLLIVCSGRFTNNAIEKICDGIERHSLKNNMMFIDGSKIENLAQKFQRDLRIV